MQHLFVTYEIAKKLKDLGFNEPCLQFFKEIDGEMYTSDDGGKNSIGLEITYPFYNFDGFPLYDTKIVSAPLWQQAIDWLLVKHFILVCQEASSHNIGTWAAFKFVSLGCTPELIIRQTEINTAIEEALKLI